MMGRQEGAAAVEFALILPVLALILFGIIQFGLVFLQTQGLEGAAREGGRAGSVGGTYEDIGTAVRDALSGLEGPLTITVTFRQGATATPVTVAVDASGSVSTAATGGPCTGDGTIEVIVDPDDPMDVVIPLWGTSSIDYKATSTFRCESLAS